MYIFYFKRFLDITISLIIFIMVLPILLIFTIILFFTNGFFGVFFFQNRPGKNEKIFKLYKFKTMNDKKDNFGKLLPDSARLTKVGKFIRSTSIDELPQLINVIKGDMSLIGPRPLLVDYIDLYSKEQKRRHNLKPGITGWAQVNGRNSIKWNEKFKLDVWYVDNCSFLLDLKIVLLTIKKIFLRKDINSKTCVTMEKFRGNE